MLRAMAPLITFAAADPLSCMPSLVQAVLEARLIVCLNTEEDWLSEAMYAAGLSQRSQQERPLT